MLLKLLIYFSPVVKKFGKSFHMRKVPYVLDLFKFDIFNDFFNERIRYIFAQKNYFGVIETSRYSA